MAKATARTQTGEAGMTVINSFTEAIQIPPEIRLRHAGKPTGCGMILQEKITEKVKGKVRRTNECRLEFLQFYAASRILCQ